jgi:predicted GNAT family acetyltransferase/uncharacterized Fe-S cluster protein YjdI
METTAKEYSNGEVTIVWKPRLCRHAAFCGGELPEVFKPRERPWIDPRGAATERIIKQVERCPSGALSYRLRENDMEVIHRDDGQNGVFVLKDGDSTAGEMTYAWDGDGRMVIDHTGVRREYEGRGLGRKLVDAAAGFAREKGIRIVPRCPFVKALFAKSASYDDVKNA